MSWTTVAYVLGGVFVVLYVLPNVLWGISRQINRYIHSHSKEARDKAPEVQAHEVGS